MSPPTIMPLPWVLSSLIRDIRTQLKGFLFQVRDGITQIRNAGTACSYSWVVKTRISPSTNRLWALMVAGGWKTPGLAKGSHKYPWPGYLLCQCPCLCPEWAESWGKTCHPSSLRCYNSSQEAFNSLWDREWIEYRPAKGEKKEIKIAKCLAGW